MRNTEKVRRSAAPNLLVQFPLAELTLQLVVDPSKSRRSIPAGADGRSQQKPTVDPSKSRWLIPTLAALAEQLRQDATLAYAPAGNATTRTDRPKEIGGGWSPRSQPRLLLTELESQSGSNIRPGRNSAAKGGVKNKSSD
jgi:hypothetical protein